MSFFFFFLEGRIRVTFHLLVHSPNGYTVGAGKGRSQKPWGGSRGPSTWAMCCCCARCLSREVDLKWNSWDSHQHSFEMPPCKKQLNALCHNTNPSSLRCLHWFTCCLEVCCFSSNLLRFFTYFFYWIHFSVNWKQTLYSFSLTLLVYFVA